MVFCLAGGQVRLAHRLLLSCGSGEVCTRQTVESDIVICRMWTPVLLRCSSTVILPVLPHLCDLKTGAKPTYVLRVSRLKVPVSWELYFGPG
jgi:hypothetical protein